MNCSEDFGPFGGKTWLNCSHQGPMPRVAAESAREAVRWKEAPFELTSDRFLDVPARLRSTLARLIGGTAEDIALANSASYGLHLLANGLPLRESDEVLLVRGDFPSVVLPWLGLEKRGVTTRFLEPPLTPDGLATAIAPRTRVLCTTWVHSFTGVALDLDAVGSLCRERDVWFLVNGAQAVGARPIDVASTPIDALVSVGFKYLCGPYGTGFCWMRPEVHERLEVNRAYWLTRQTADDLGKEDTLPPPGDDLGASTYDIFGTANFFNFVPWTVSIDYLLDKGIGAIARHDGALVDRLVEGLTARGYRVLSPKAGRERSTLVLATHEERSRNENIHRALVERGIHIAYRRGNLRFSPHLYNTDDDIDRALDAIDECRVR